MKRRDPILEQNQAKTTLAVFLEAYNKSVPESFPKATIKSVKAFQALHPTLFKSGNQWSIELHRKKLMDWLPTYHVS